MRATVRAAQTSSVIPDGVREVLHGMDDAAVVVDTSSTVLAASAAAVPFHLAEGSVLPSDELRAVARRVRQDESATTVTLRLRRGAPPAEPRLVVVRATRISPRLTLLVLRDITERERVEQMRRDFVANTSHELKTPVGAVSLLAEAIESAADDPDQVRNFASRLTAEASRLALLTSRIMNLSRLQAADELTDEREVAVDEIVASAVEAHAIQAGSAGVEIVRGGDAGPVRARRRAGAERGRRQPARERHRLLAEGLERGGRRQGRRPASSRSPSPTGASASPRATRSACSNASTAPTRHARAAPAAPASGSRSSSTRCSATAARCGCGRAPVAAPPSPSASR